MFPNYAEKNEKLICVIYVRKLKHYFRQFSKNQKNFLSMKPCFLQLRKQNTSPSISKYSRKISQLVGFEPTICWLPERSLIADEYCANRQRFCSSSRSLCHAQNQEKEKKTLFTTYLQLQRNEVAHKQQVRIPHNPPKYFISQKLYFF